MWIPGESEIEPAIMQEGDAAVRQHDDKLLRPDTRGRPRWAADYGRCSRKIPFSTDSKKNVSIRTTHGVQAASD